MAPRNLRNLPAIFGSDWNGLTGQGEIYDDELQGGVAVDANDAPVNYAPLGSAKYDTGDSSPIPDVQPTAPQPSQLPTTTMAQLQPSAPPPGPPSTPESAPSASAPSILPPENPLLTANLNQGQGPTREAAARATARASQLPPSPDLQRIAQMGQNEPELPGHVPWWRQVLAGMAPPQFSGLVAYGPKGEEQIRRHQLWEQNLPRAEEAAKELSAEQNRRYLADITRSESEARIQAERDRDKATAAHQLADDQLNQAKVRLEYQDPTKTGGKIAYTPEAAEQLASMNHIWQETVPPSFAGKDERWFSPVENTVTAEMAASPIGRRMGWQEGQHLNGEAYRAAVTGNFEAILHGGGPGDPMEVKNAIFGSIPAKYQDLRDSTWAQAQFYLNDKSGDKLKNAEAARQVMEKGFQLSEERLRQERQQQFEKEKEAANRGALGKDPNTGLITWTPVGQRQTPGTMTVGQAGQIAQQAAKDVGNAVKSAEDMQESAKNAAGLVAMANNGNPMADRTLLFQFLGATKPEGMGKLRLSNQEINFVLSARSALGDLDALWNKISSGGNLATKERQDILDIMNYMAARAAEHAKEKQAAAPGGRGVTTTPITPPSSTPATPPSAEDVKKKHNINY